MARKTKAAGAAAAPQVDATYSIGDLAEACGISVDTLRVWERRSGRPEPVRLPAGHRRYTSSHVRWLRRVATALAAGHRAGAAVAASEEQLEQMIASAAAAQVPAEGLDPFFDAVKTYRESAILERLWDGWRRLGPDGLLEHVLDPLLVRAGRAWADGDLDVRHEHFLSDAVEHFLRAARASVEVRKDGRLIVLTTLPGEMHGLGIQMAAIVAARTGWRPRVLGVNTPLDETVRAAGETRADAVGISISLHTGGVESDRLLAGLRERLAPEVRLIAGGSGARGVRRGPRGIAYATTLADLRRILREA
ncbi:MAG: cobalamin-dependent protein [Planctomycetes bacterium]|nr:cobalamin-dependent protein [Planctomycetota bacterium]